MFGKKNDSATDDTQATIERLNALSLEELAAQVKSVMLAATGNADRGRLSVHDIALTMVPNSVRLEQDAIWALDELIGEGIQQLEHTGQVQCTVVATDRRLEWVLTRLGRNNSN
jgi:hypothetical protein